MPFDNGSLLETPSMRRYHPNVNSFGCSKLLLTLALRDDLERSQPERFEGRSGLSCDLFRIENGLIAEHWDVLQTDPNSRGKTFDTLGKNGAGHTLFE